MLSQKSGLLAMLLGGCVLSHRLPRPHRRGPYPLHGGYESHALGLGQ